MTAPAAPGIAPEPTPHRAAIRPRASSHAGHIWDKLLVGSTLAGAWAMIGLLALLIVILVMGSWPAIQKFGITVLTSSNWDETNDIYGGLAMIFGTLVTSSIAVVLAVPISIGAAIFLVKLAPRWLVNPASFLIELLAAIPSITYGFWGIFVLVPIMKRYIEPGLKMTVGHIPGIGRFFSGPAYGAGMLTAGIVLAIMILPIITAVTRDVLRAVPGELEQGAYGLGATWWQAQKVVLSFARTGIMGAVILGLARALGETMAVTMVIGSNQQIKPSLFSFGETIASILANKYRDSASDLEVQSLTYLALALLLITVIINGAARILVGRVAKVGKA